MSNQDKNTLRMIELKAKGLIPDEAIFLYGISGDLPDLESYSKLSRDEIKKLWEDRLKSKLGKNWRKIVSKIPAIFCDENFDWEKEGF